LADESKAPWLNWLAITTILFSACATFSTFKGGGFSTKAVLAQSNASDMWAFYQAKSVKQHTYEIQKGILELQKIGVENPAQADAYSAKIEDYSKQVQRYDREKKEVSDSARVFEKLRTNYQKNSGIFGVAVMYLQVAIVLSGLAALLKKKMVWYLGCGLGFIGVASFANGFLHFF
jgi:hypothetical protein